MEIECSLGDLSLSLGGLESVSCFFHLLGRSCQGFVDSPIF